MKRLLFFNFDEVQTQKISTSTILIIKHENSFHDESKNPIWYYGYSYISKKCGQIWRGLTLKK